MSKPNIEQVFEAFQKFQIRSVSLIRDNKPGEWAGKMKESQDELRSDLEKLGIAKYIDWKQES